MRGKKSNIFADNVNVVGIMVVGIMNEKPIPLHSPFGSEKLLPEKFTASIVARTAFTVF